jgi:diguanylate cyclase (GGDEF)-like protein
MELKPSQYAGMRALRSRRSLVLTTAYASLIGLAALAWSSVDVHVGTLAVIPILFISYYVRMAIALATAFCSGIILGLLDAGTPALRRAIDFPRVFEALILAAVLCTIVLIARRLRQTSLANEVLHGSLAQARRAAERDPLTGLANRAALNKALEDALQSSHTGECVAVLFCDLDGFKFINDHYGHLIGDGVLQMVAARLLHIVRAGDVVARLGGDEFCVLVRRAHDAGEAERIRANIYSAFYDPFHYGQHDFAVGITVGIGMFPQDGSDAKSLLALADERMYQAKKAKRRAR